MRTLPLIAVSIAALSLAACGPREPGPHESEWGQVFFWQVVDATSTVTDCTDAADWAEVVAPPEFGENTYLIYLVQEGGQTALDQDCDVLDASDCTDGTIVYDIDGHTLTHEPEVDTTAVAEGCDLLGSQSLVVEDDGETGTFTLDIWFDYDPVDGACATYEAALVASSSNDEGLADCELSVVVDLELDLVQAP